MFASSPDDHWDTLKNPDRNSAAFVGVILADVIDLDRRHPSLDSDVRQKVEDATRLAVEQVISRNVTQGYTNIAILSTALAAAGQKLWAMPGAGAFAQAKLDAILALTGENEFCEYLSPTYTGVSLYGAYMARKFAFSDAFAAEVDGAIDHLWKETAASYHAPTCQLAGPYTRDYGEDMLDYAAFLKYLIFLGLDGAYPLPDTEIEHDEDKSALLCIADLPIVPRPELKLPNPAWRQFTAVALDLTTVRHLSQYRDGNFVLGTVAVQDEWKQRRNLVADWRNDGSGPGGFRVGFCLDESSETFPEGFHGENIHFYSRQEKGAALVAMVSSSDVPRKGGCLLVFDSTAKVAGGDVPRIPLRVDDGSITAYVYPVSMGAAAFTTQASAKYLRLIRPWTSADPLGSLRVLAYLIVFRAPDQPVPVVAGLVLSTNEKGASASAKSDGIDLSVSFNN